MADIDTVFSAEWLAELFPPSRADEFFEALFGGAEEGSYDIELAYSGARGNTLDFEFRLRQRPGKCLACSLTYGLPQVFSRHPIINASGLARQIAERSGMEGEPSWQLDATRELSRTVHSVPFTITIS
ncbi:pancreas/duodenum homeobox protein 1 [Pseudodesulfovibrio tunisiensis]|uniref:pancreas/duodenum homeobox protein 1 n=1 Tax=Pseudodesulfovibrio tunisiensis TaxID=463192 RepID=UPI001FB20450|nr:pancreas/duodenum homeobox protein 1 [Pseudodesulfovibrio tunisiensis]